MSTGSPLSGSSMLDLFRIEVETQTAALTSGLLALERQAGDAALLEAMMRAAHSLKGAARIVDVDPAEQVAHAMEELFVAAQAGRLTLERPQVDVLLRSVDLLGRIARSGDAEMGDWSSATGAGEVAEVVRDLGQALVGGGSTARPPLPSTSSPPLPSTSTPPLPSTPLARAAPGALAPAAGPSDPVASMPGDAPPVAPGSSEAAPTGSRGVLRISAESVDRMLGLAGESLVESRWLGPFSAALLRLKRMQVDLGRTLDQLRETLSSRPIDEAAQSYLADAQNRLSDCRQLLMSRLVDLEMHDRRSTHLSHRLYEEALSCRMRPFSDGTRGFPRMVRDLARSLGKEVRLEIVGETTQVDRDVLERLEAPLTHLLRNAVDHGIESPEERRQGGKPAEGTIRLEARHSAGKLLVVVSDDGRGIDLEAVGQAAARRRLTNLETVARLTRDELLDFLLLPGFSMREEVTEISGRGVGLDVVHDMVKSVRGMVRLSTEPGRGMRFQLELPLTLSVVRALLVEVGGEPYALPLAYIDRTLKLERGQIQAIEGRQHFLLDDASVGLVTVHQLLELSSTPSALDAVPVVILGARGERHGLVVDRFLGERELVVQPLDPRLGKIKDIAAGALMENGAPVLILDAEDLLRSIDKLVRTGHLSRIQANGGGAVTRPAKRVLVVDDSLTVRGVERQILETHGFEVEVAVDGMDGWNAVRSGHFDLVISDIDMPRMDGFELVSLIKKDPRLKSLPVMIVSYKDRDEDRHRGLNAGADYYLTKGSFHDESLLHAVVDLIGEAGS